MNNRTIKKNELKISPARTNGLVIKKLADEVLVYDTERNNAHCLNRNAALIWEHCDGARTVRELSEILQSTTNDRAIADKEAEDLVWVALEQLEESHLLQTQLAKQPATNRLSRRQVMKAMGIAAVIAVPVVSTIVAPTAAQAATCSASGQSCTLSAECCSGLCNVNVCA